MKTKKSSLIAGISVLTLMIVLAVVYAVITSSSVSAEKNDPPCDIDDSYAREAILTVTEKGLMTTKTEDGKIYFHPEQEVTRGEIAKVLANYLEIDTKAYENTALGFADEAQIAKEYLAYIRAALSTGYIKLNSDYTFRADAAISREETADIFSSVCTLAVSAGKSEKFSDFKEVSPHFERSARKIIDLEIMIGYPDDTFRPKTNLTREQLALILHRLLKYNADSEIP
ncbi:MAG: S-layer homology domain-containing protein [Clostridia bacterium]|nr:S-layer homology domain-containing protein [Clostridia bacterium]